jgi:hypothetical protein
MKKLSEKLMNVQNLRDVLLERLFERASSKYLNLLKIEKIIQKTKEDYYLNFTSI